MCLRLAEQQKKRIDGASIAASTEINLAFVGKLHFRVELVAVSQEEKSSLPLPSHHQLSKCSSPMPVSPAKVCPKVFAAYCCFQVFF
ncbi:hypothetical protein AVEN_154100-1 [Araneus ventricosus]|uniref:Uncharacterized protein n=1 Tax=Araneus ventricosus TaxID=182803 RepID=A0A4Y2W6C0_ARAVE|nr:hypothetical protein AVEN_154100-1 [Araneus ventricosus]